MQVSVDWLKRYVPVKASVHQIAERLTMTVNEVDEIKSLDGLGKVIVGEVLTSEPHPDADLNVGDIRIGAKQIKRIIFRDRTLEPGQKVPVVLPGTTLPNGLTIKRRTLRGLESEGMLCSARELSAGEDDSGVWVLPADCPVGQPLPKALGNRNDSFDLDVPANRPDLMGHLGIAREVAAGFGTKLVEPKLKTPNRKRKGAFTPKIVGHASRFTLARIRGIKNGQSPDWIKERLVSAGLRPVNAVVDVTNFVMLETGQPLHAYDFSTLTGVMMYIRPSRKDESVKTLDGKSWKLPAGTPVIADRTQVLGIAGIMGGSSSEVKGKTDDIVLECATFDAVSVRRASRKLGLRTDASARFEKGLPAEQAWPVLRRAVDLILETCGGTLVELTDTYPRKQKIPTVSLEGERLERLIGEAVPLSPAKKSLERLGFAVTSSKQTLRLKPPYWRPDIVTEADVVEEVTRMIGYDKLPSTIPSGQLGVPSRPRLAGLQERIRETLIGAGYTEVVTHSLLGRKLLERAGYPETSLVRMQNPISSDHEFLRRSMEPRHLESVTDNLRWQNRLRFLEIGRTFKQPPKAAIVERSRLLVTVASKQPSDTFEEVRGALDLLTGVLRLNPKQTSFTDIAETPYASGRQFNIVYGKAIVGHIAEYAAPRDWKAGSVAFLSFELDKLAEVVSRQWRVAPPPIFPPVHRSISLEVPEDLKFRKLSEVLVTAGGRLLREVRVPSGKGRAEYRGQGKRVLTAELRFWADDHTLTDKEVTRLMETIEASAKEHGWKTRE